MIFLHYLESPNIFCNLFEKAVHKKSDEIEIGEGTKIFGSKFLSNPRTEKYHSVLSLAVHKYMYLELLPQCLYNLVKNYDFPF